MSRKRKNKPFFSFYDTVYYDSDFYRPAVDDVLLGVQPAPIEAIVKDPIEDPVDKADRLLQRYVRRKGTC